MKKDRVALLRLRLPDAARKPRRGVHLIPICVVAPNLRMIAVNRQNARRVPVHLNPGLNPGLHLDQNPGLNPGLHLDRNHTVANPNPGQWQPQVNGALLPVGHLPRMPERDRHWVGQQRIPRHGSVPKAQRRGNVVAKLMHPDGEKGARVTRIDCRDTGAVMSDLTGGDPGKPRALKLLHPYSVMVSPSPPRRWCMKSL